MTTTGREGFEYENVESEAAFESSDEVFETSDESDGEVYETSDESSDESDGESLYEAADESADEGMEAYESDGESLLDETADEAAPPVTATPGARRWVGQVQADQRKEAARAVATQQDITRRLRAIPAVPQARYAAIARLQGGHVFTARLENGRTARMILSPTPAPVAEVNKLRAVINANDKRQSAALTANARALKALAVTQAAAVKKLTSEQVKSDRELSRRMSEGLTRIDKRITSELSTRGGSLAKHSKRMDTMLRRHRRRSLARTLSLTTAMPVFAAYGDRSNPFSKANLTLTGTLAASVVAPEVMDLLGGSGKSGATFRRLGDFAAYAGPAVTPGLGYLMFRNKQTERFVTGIEGALVASGNKETTFAVAADSAGDFGKLAGAKKVPVAVTKLAGPGSITAAAFQDGKLVLTSDANVTGETKVAWMVDTQPTGA